MIIHETVISKFHKKGEKSGWTYVEIPAFISEKINPGIKKIYRIKGKTDDTDFSGISIYPMGEGNFIMPLNSSLRKKLSKGIGEKITLFLEVDTEIKPLDEEFLCILKEEPKAYEKYFLLSPSHQKYFSNWIASAKTMSTKAERIAKSINALLLNQSFGEMLRSNKKANSI